MKARILLAAGAAALALTSAAALGGSGVGGVFNLGQGNTVDAATSVSGTVNGDGQLVAKNDSTAATSFGVLGKMTSGSASASSAGLRGVNQGAGYGAYGSSGDGIGVLGKHTAATGSGAGVEGNSASASSSGVLGKNTAGGPGLQAIVNMGVPPLEVNSPTRVDSLNADFVDGQSASAFLPAGGTAVNAEELDGLDSTVIAQRQPPEELSIEFPDTTGDVGRYTAATIGADGRGLISYFDDTNDDLKVLHCSDRECSGGTKTVLDSAGAVGRYTSIAIGTDGLGLISYYDTTNGNLKVAHCSNIECTSATKTTLDSAGSVGMYTSITIAGDGLGLISYRDSTNGDLKTAHCSNVACTSATTATIVGTGNVGFYTSIASHGTALISYYDATNGDLKVAHCLDFPCSSVSFNTTLDSTGNVGTFTSITIGGDGLALISYYDATNDTLKAAHCSGEFCLSATKATLDFGGGSDTSATVGADGLGLISYRAATNLKVAHCVSLTCSAAVPAALDAGPLVGQSTSVTIGVDGLPLISHYDGSAGDLRVDHCSSQLCQFYFRRR